MYPLNVANPAIGGYAVASDEPEHKALSDAGYLPAYVAAVSEEDAVRAKLDAAGIAYDKRLGLAKLQALLPAA